MVLENNTVGRRRSIRSVLDLIWHARLRLPSCGVGRHVDVEELPVKSALFVMVLITWEWRII